MMIIAIMIMVMMVIVIIIMMVIMMVRLVANISFLIGCAYFVAGDRLSFIHLYQHPSITIIIIYLYYH